MIRCARAILTLSLCTCALSAATEEGSPLDEHIEAMRSQGQAERKKGVEGILAARRRTIGAVEKLAKSLLKSPGREGSAKDAILLLGKLRSTQSVPMLVHNLTFHVFYKSVKRPQSRDDAYPCLGALIEIGMPAVEPTMRRAEAADDKRVHASAAYLLEKVLGSDLALAYLRNRRATTEDAAQRGRLDRVLAHLIPPEAR